MIAAARSYLYEEPQPHELRLALQVDRWGALPTQGGLLDQEAGLLERMGWASAVYNAFRGRATARDVIRWIDSNPEAHELYAYVMQMIGLVDDGMTAEKAKAEIQARIDGNR